MGGSQSDVAGFRAERPITFVFLAFGLAVAMIWELGINQATAGSGTLRKVSSDVLVTLDVFSGRPNPSWTLSVNEEEELARRLQSLPPSVQSLVGSDLGYRGFRIINNSKTLHFPSEIVVAQGVVTVKDDRGTHHYIDANGIEAWLIEQARRRGYGALNRGP